MSKRPTSRIPDLGGMNWRARALMIFLIVVAVAVVWWTNVFLTERFTESTKNRAELRLALYGGNLLSELRQNAIVPQLLARDAELIWGAQLQGLYRLHAAIDFLCGGNRCRLADAL